MSVTSRAVSRGQENSWPLPRQLSKAGDGVGALCAFEDALNHKPDDVAARLELGDFHLDLAQWERARDRYREALELADDESWARPSWMFAELRLSDDAEWEKEPLSLESLRLIEKTEVVLPSIQPSTFNLQL